MSPLTHLLVSWIVAVKAADNPRDTRLVALAGILPDADGLGIVVDMIKHPSLDGGAFYFQEYHHFLAHGILGALVISGALTLFAQHRWRVFGLALLVFHVHLICDLLGSRGPSAQDIWPIYYLGPFTRNILEIVWAHQWELGGWQNRIISLALFAWIFQIALHDGKSFVGVFSQRADRNVIAILRNWRDKIWARSQ
jgi:hypothetical protein